MKFRKHMLLSYNFFRCGDVGGTLSNTKTMNKYGPVLDTSISSPDFDNRPIPVEDNTIGSYTPEHHSSSYQSVAPGYERPPFQSSAQTPITPAPSQAQVATQSQSAADKAKATVREFGISLDKPKHAQFAVLAIRVKTYESAWPQNLTQTPTVLAEAGFFFSGLNLHVHWTFLLYMHDGNLLQM